MWCGVLCTVLVLLPRCVFGGKAEEMAETTQRCCEQGTRYARNHTSDECSSSVPPDVQPTFGSLCIFAMDQCCKEYFQKKQDCDDGAELAQKGQCESSTDFTKSCCNECARGRAVGSTLGESACVSNVRGMSAEELLAGDMYEACCKKGATEGPDQSPNEDVPTTKKSASVLPSLCEDYAPNELCAHHCIPVPGSYKCECNPGFRLMADGRNCIEVLENRCKLHNPCQHKCNDNGVDIKCSCRRGYELMVDGKSCTDIDECALANPVCLPGTQCNNIQGSYKCIPTKSSYKDISSEKGQCPSGFARNINNNACDDINECALPHPPCPKYLCENTMGGYKCGGIPGDPVNLPSSGRAMAEDRCPPGFRAGYNEECEDVDECSMYNDDCNTLSQFCINTRGSFYCQDKASKHCPPGFKIDQRTNKCEDIDECEDSEDICRPDQVCVNQLGQYDCKLKNSFRKHHDCPIGMRLKQGTTICEDIDECVEGTHLCDQHQNCLNTNGSHECLCKIGFEHDATTGACVDVNECASNRHDCISDTQRCDNTVGSFLCIRFTSCGTGYILHHATGKCEDIDECVLGTHNCARAGPEYICVNIPGSFRCNRKRAPTTSTTTPLPEYEYYYDSDEDLTESNGTKPQTENQPETKGDEKLPSTTTASRPETSSEPSTTPLSTKPTEPPQPEEPIRTPEDIPTRPDEDDRINEIIPQQPTERTYEARTPNPTTPETYQPNPPYEPRHPQIVFNPPATEPIFIPNPEEPNNNYEPKVTELNHGESPSLNESIQPENTEPIEPDTTYRPISSSEPPILTPPILVNVDVGKETATVTAEKADDGSVIINTGDVPKNEWTKVNEKPTNCQFGFELGEYGACYDINECTTNRHKCSGLTEVCRNTIGGYLCECAPGFRRDLFTGACDPIVISTSTTTSTTVPPPTTTPKHYFWGYPEYRPATVRPFRPRNLCDVGFHLNSQTGKCEDVNECVNGQANCGAVEICVNTQGGYRCECPPNWHLDEIKHRCVPNRTNERFPTGYGNQPVYQHVPQYPASGTKDANSVDPEITQIENRGTVIRCPWGYRLGDDSTCEDIDECVTGDAKCGPLQICTNRDGGYFCSCPTGHRLVGDHECEDVDECALAGNMPICSQNADCLNTVGSYQCRCHEGFRSAPVNDKVCVDVDECTESRAGSLCEQRCNNVWGSYRCSCHRGYRIKADNSTCADIDECTEFKAKVPCVGKCLNLPGSYRCACPVGYRLAEDKSSCIDIDECETGEAPCAGNSWSGSGSSNVCLNTRGGYRCQRITCPAGYQLESKNRCTKVERVCPPADWECAHQPSTYSYNFITFVSNLYIPASKVDLFTMRGPTWTHAKIRFQLKLGDVIAPPSVKNKADINSFLLVQTGNQGVVSLVRSLEGPQSIELEVIMELYNREQFGGIAVAKLFIFVSEYEF